ncbi:MAG TPA: DUF5060 domain-containing protein, partial [Pyrinomonadaceae bacterium]|nr:DUF5060 domain-containing protein [Pyrinomonadaceae bacterium]
MPVSSSGAVASTEAVAQVPLWESFEGSVQNSKHYSDPYDGVTLEVTYTRPDGTSLPFWGFYDGGTTWRFRMMCDRLGTWSYSARFSDGTSGGSGSFECLNSSADGRFSDYLPNPLWFGRSGSPPELVRSFHVGDRFFASNWDDPQNPNDGNKRTAFLNWAQQQGYNTLSVASHYLARDDEGRADGWTLPDLWNGTTQRPQAAAFQQAEVILDDLMSRGMSVYSFAGFFGKDSDAPTNGAEQEEYIRYTLARLAPYSNVLLNVGGPEPTLSMTKDQVDALGDMISELDVFRHPLSAHNKIGNDKFINESWATYVTLQGPKTTDLSV